MDGIRSNQIAVCDQAIIKRLNISTPFSSTDGDIRYDQPLPLANYKGMYLVGKPRGNEPGRYWFQLRGSLIKLANNGLHSNDFKDPYELLYALDDLIVNLRIDPFRTPLNGLELSATISVDDPKQVCSSIVSYLNHPPSISTLDRDGLRLPYVEIEAGQHVLKVYSPRAGALRVEVKVNKMQYLGSNRPATLADLIQPRYAATMAEKLLTVFRKIIWKYPNLNINNLTPSERELYQNGRVYEYWLVRRQDYNDYTDFKRTEKKRGRERADYNELVRRHWINESPDELERRLQQQLNNNCELMQTRLYQTLLDICLSRWQYVGNLPGVIRLPKHLKLPDLSEIYRLYLGKSSTRYLNRLPCRTTDLTRTKNPPLDLFSQYEGSVDSLLTHKWNHHQKGFAADSTFNLQYDPKRKSFTDELGRLKNLVNRPGGLNGSLAEINSILSARTRIALAYTGQSVDWLLCSNRQQFHQSRPTPLFSV